MNLTPGGNAPVPAQELRVRILSGGPVDASAFRLFADGKVQETRIWSSTDSPVTTTALSVIILREITALLSLT